MHLTQLIATAALVTYAFAHPGHSVHDEFNERRVSLSGVEPLDLRHCAAQLQVRGVLAGNIARRQAEVEKARVKRGLEQRNLPKVLGTNHNETSLGYYPNTDHGTLFGGYKSCVLTPYSIEGPYWVGGELVRKNVIENQAGVHTVLDYQVVDVNTCEPVSDVFLETWSCNATGVYGGVVAGSDRGNLENTFLRGIQKTDKDGVAQFETIFPGHYGGRANHVHVMVHTSAALYKNNTLGSQHQASHLGQAFFDQDLVDAIERLPPYNTNKQRFTRNKDDSWLADEARTDGVDPVYEYTLLGDFVEDGLFGWLAFGINATVARDVRAANWYQGNKLMT